MKNPPFVASEVLSEKSTVALTYQTTTASFDDLKYLKQLDVDYAQQLMKSFQEHVYSQIDQIAQTMLAGKKIPVSKKTLIVDNKGKIPANLAAAAYLEFSPTPPVKRLAPVDTLYTYPTDAQPVFGPPTTRYGTVVDLLTEAYQLISDPKRITFCGYAKTATDDSVSPIDGHAVKFCSVGALIHSAHRRYTREQFEQAYHYLQRSAFIGTASHNIESLHDCTPRLINEMWTHAIWLASNDRQ